jgi:hypothetical protein
MTPGSRGGSGGELSYGAQLRSVLPSAAKRQEYREAFRDGGHPRSPAPHAIHNYCQYLWRRPHLALGRSPDARWPGRPLPAPYRLSEGATSAASSAFRPPAAAIDRRIGAVVVRGIRRRWRSVKQALTALSRRRTTLRLDPSAACRLCRLARSRGLSQDPAPGRAGPTITLSYCSPARRTRLSST